MQIVWCKNGKCENCEERKSMALAIVNQEIKDINSDEQTQATSNL